MSDPMSDPSRVVLNLQAKAICQLCSLPGFMHISERLPNNSYADGWLCHLHAPYFHAGVIAWNPRTGHFVRPDVRRERCQWTCVTCGAVLAERVLITDATHQSDSSWMPPDLLLAHTEATGHTQAITRFVLYEPVNDEHAPEGGPDARK